MLEQKWKLARMEQPDKMISSEQRQGAQRFWGSSCWEAPPRCPHSGVTAPPRHLPYACPTPELPGSRWAPMSLPGQ